MLALYTGVNNAMGKAQRGVGRSVPRLVMEAGKLCKESLVAGWAIRRGRPPSAGLLDDGARQIDSFIGQVPCMTVPDQGDQAVRPGDGQG